MLRTTKLHGLLTNLDRWDERTWFEAERYLIDNMSVPGMMVLVGLAGCEPTGAALYFKTDAVKLLHEVRPAQVLTAWDQFRRLRAIAA